MTAHLAAPWRAYRKAVARDAGPHKVAALKDAFRAGMETMLNAMLVGLRDSVDPTASAHQRWAELRAELETWRDGVEETS